MADRKITDLTALAAGSQATGDLVTVVDVSEAAAADKNKKMTMENLFKGIPSNVGIGTSAPSAQIHLNQSGTGSYSTLKLSNSGASGRTYEIGVGGSTSSSGYAGNLYFYDSTAGSLRAVINSSGHLGIGTTSPNSKLTLSTGDKIFVPTGEALNFGHTDGSTNTERMRIDSSGRLLLNNTSARTDFFGATGLNALLNIEGTNNSTRATSIIHNSNDPAQHLFVLGKTRGAAAGAVTVVADDDPLGGVSFQGADGAKLVEAARVEASVDGTPGTDDMPGRITFSTRTDGSSGTLQERIRIDSSGNVGIGATSPGRLLHLKAASSTAYSGGSDTADYNFLKIENTTNDKSAGIFFQIGGNGEAAITATEVADGNTDIAFQNRGGGVRSEKARLDSSGRLLVGTTSARANFYNASNTANILVEGLSSTTSTIAAVSNKLNTDPNNEPTFVLGRSGTDALGSTTIVADNNAVGRVSFQGTDGTDFVELAHIRGLVDGTPGANDMPGRLILATTADGGSSPTERVRIDSSGNVGIGVTNPDHRLTVSSTASATAAKFIHTASANTYLRFQNTDNEHGYVGYETKALGFYASNSGGTGADKIGRWDTDGIKFNSDSAAANALSDYEEGDFTPSWGVGITSPSYATQSGKYTKIGRTVYFTLQISTNGGTANSSDVRIDGLPFNAIGTSVTGGAFANYFAGWGIDTPFFYKNQSDATISIYAQSNGAAIDGTDGSGIANLNLYLTGFYHVS